MHNKLIQIDDQQAIQDRWKENIEYIFKDDRGEISQMDNTEGPIIINEELFLDLKRLLETIHVIILYRLIFRDKSSFKKKWVSPSS